VKSAIIDGEVVVPASDGTTDFAVLQKVLGAGKAWLRFLFWASRNVGWASPRLPLMQTENTSLRFIGNQAEQTGYVRIWFGQSQLSISKGTGVRHASLKVSWRSQPT
jgi:hypothetical protein